MRIECVSSTSHRSAMTVVCDGEPWCDVHTSIFGRKPSLPQNCLSAEQFQEEFQNLEYLMAKKYALKRLSLQAMLSTRLARSLKERLVSESAIEKVVTDLSGLGLLNDQEWVDSFVRVQSAKRVGPRAIAQKLAAKGMRDPKAIKALEDSMDPAQQKKSIQHLLKTRYAKRNLDDPRERQKVIASLARRGFDFPAILSLIKEEW